MCERCGKEVMCEKCGKEVMCERCDNYKIYMRIVQEQSEIGVMTV